MTNFKDITGRKFGRLTALEPKREKGKAIKWRCKCECGTEKIVRSTVLINGHTRSCGCLLKEKTGERARKHGLGKTKLYTTWKGMRARCQNRNCVHYKNYGGRGISICAEWDDFKIFYIWSLKNGYKDELTLDRIDNDGNYSPDNCRWVSLETQANNKSTNVCFPIDGVVRTLSEHAKFYNVNYGTFASRYKSGLRDKDLIVEPKQTYKKIIITINGENKSLRAWANHYGIKYATVHRRYQKGIRGMGLFVPVKTNKKRG